MSLSEEVRVAVIVCEPTVREEVLKLALVTPPEVLTFTGPPALLPSTKNWTVPVGVPLPAVMVAVKVRAWPKTDGLTDVTRAVVVAALFWTSWPLLKEPVLAAKFPSPL